MFDNFRKSLETCNTCPSLCQSACPILMQDGNRSHAPWGLMQLMNRVRTGLLPFTPEVARASYHCLTCRGCLMQCEHGVEVPPVMQEARVAAVKQELAPVEILNYIEEFHHHNNPFASDLLQTLHGIIPKKYFKETSVVYYASCTTIARNPDTLRDTFLLFDKLGIDWVSPYPDPVQCCGYPLLNAGAEYDFIDLAEINFKTLKKYKTIIVGSPACAFTLKQTYKEHHFDLTSKVITINEFLKPIIESKKFKRKKRPQTKTAYHDACHLSRYLKQSELPREIFSLITENKLTEFHENCEKSLCSGQGGCYAVIAPQNADDITRRRLQECAEKKVDTVLTQCPTCIDKMRRLNPKLQVRDLVSFLNDAIDTAPPL